MYYASFIIFIITNKCTINIITICIITVFPCIIDTPTCSDILCHHLGVTHLLLAKLNKFLDYSF